MRIIERHPLTLPEGEDHRIFVLEDDGTNGPVSRAWQDTYGALQEIDMDHIDIMKLFDGSNQPSIRLYQELINQTLHRENDATRDTAEMTAIAICTLQHLYPLPRGLAAFSVDYNISSLAKLERQPDGMYIGTKHIPVDAGVFAAHILEIYDDLRLDTPYFQVVFEYEPQILPGDTLAHVFSPFIDELPDTCSVTGNFHMMFIKRDSIHDTDPDLKDIFPQHEICDVHVESEMHVWSVEDDDETLKEFGRVRIVDKRRSEYSDFAVGFYRPYREPTEVYLRTPANDEVRHCTSDTTPEDVQEAQQFHDRLTRVVLQAVGT